MHKNYSTNIACILKLRITHSLGVNLFDFVDLEDFFKINLVAYELEEGVAKLV